MTDVSVIIATADRPNLLKRTLQGLTQSHFPTDRWELIVADNGDDERTRQVCIDFKYDLDLRYLLCPKRGKNRALNCAVDQARGSLLAFTDDDVDVSQTWLRELWAGSRRWPGHRVFGGRILPILPDRCPSHLEASKYRAMIFAELDRDQPERPDSDFLPFGPNLAIEKSVFDGGFRFNSYIGPGTASSYVMGGETELLRRLKYGGRCAVFLPDALVRHRIRKVQYSLAWLLGRGVRFGKQLAFEAGTPPGQRWFDIPRWLFRTFAREAVSSLSLLLRRENAAAFDRAMDAAVTMGRMAYYRNRDSA